MPGAATHEAPSQPKVENATQPKGIENRTPQTSETKSINEAEKYFPSDVVNVKSNVLCERKQQQQQQGVPKQNFALPPKILVETCESLKDNTSIDCIHVQDYAPVVSTSEPPKTEKSGYKSFVARSMSRNKGNSSVSSSPKLLKRKNPLLASKSRTCVH